MSSQDMAYWARALANAPVLREEHKPEAKPAPTATPFLDRLAYMQDKGMIAPTAKPLSRHKWCGVCQTHNCIFAE